MAYRKDTKDRRESLSKSLRLASLDGTLAPGSMLPTVRELSERHRLSVRIVSRELQTLIDEGVLYTVPRVGTYVGRPVERLTDTFLMLYNWPAHVTPLRIGFEERIAELGGSSMAMMLPAAIALRERGELPPLSGVFDFAYRPMTTVAWSPESGVPYVGFGSSERPELVQQTGFSDTIYFDDIDAGRQATRHLQQLGHTRIACLGLHRLDVASGLYLWSQRRAQGWRLAMKEGETDVDGLLYCPEIEPRNYDGETRAAEKAACNIIREGRATAVVCVNDNAVLGLVDALRNENVPADRWPGIIGFEDDAPSKQHLFSAMRVPWESAGRAAADLLWERRTGRLTGPPEERTIKMRLVPRTVSASPRSRKSMALEVIELAR
ncbi:MAG TPA: substrate-binding domain-containing protein [Capsulimonadaceae bacterium]|jgi:hypothetical protein